MKSDRSSRFSYSLETSVAEQGFSYWNDASNVHVDSLFSF